MQDGVGRRQGEGSIRRDSRRRCCFLSAPLACRTAEGSFRIPLVDVARNLLSLVLYRQSFREKNLLSLPPNPALNTTDKADL